MENVAGPAHPVSYPPLPRLMGGGESTASTPPSAEETAATPAPTFRDLLAIVNPLQHLPVVGTVYRHLTCDVPHPAARVIGGMLFGGPVGLFGSAITAMVEQVSGKNTGELVAGLFAPPAPASDEADTAAAAPPPAPTTPDGPAPAQAPALQEKATVPTAASKSAIAAQAAAADAPAPASPPQRPTGGRDLLFYQTHAGSRVAATVSATAPAAGSPSGVQAPARPRPALPVFGPASPAPTTGAAPNTAPSTTPAAPVVPLPSTTAPAQGSADFAQRMLQGMERYRALSRAATIAPQIDLSE